MSEKKKRKKNPKVIGILAGVAAAGVLFAFHRTGWLLNLLLGAFVGWVVSVMAGGLDVSKSAPAQNSIQSTGNQEADSMIEVGQSLMHEIQQENAKIPDEALTKKIDQLGDVSDRIFRTVADQPQKAPQIRRFMNYYLPTVKKMLTAYRQMEERQVSGKNADETKKQIEEAMDVVLQAFNRQLDTLYQNDMLDISTDIDVLETLLKQDGLVESELTKGAEQVETAASEAVKQNPSSFPSAQATAQQQQE